MCISAQVIHRAIEDTLLLSFSLTAVYQPDLAVEQSGISYNTMVSFVRSGSSTRTFDFPIRADNVALEAVEREILSFTGSSHIAGVNLGLSTTATITDIDGKSYTNQYPPYNLLLFFQW